SVRLSSIGLRCQLVGCRRVELGPYLARPIRRPFLAPSSLGLAFASGRFHALAQGPLFVVGELAANIGAPGPLDSAPPASERAGRDSVAVQHIPSAVIGLAAVGAEPMQHAVRLDPVGNGKARPLD